MSKYDIFYKIASTYTEDTKPLRMIEKLALTLLVLAGLYVWLTPDAPSSEMPMATHPHHFRTIHIHRRICDMHACKVVDVTLHPRVI